jgi:hypothetical protein
MKLGVHLLETCRLRKETTSGAARAEAEWWEQKILRDIEEFECSARSSERSQSLPGGKRKEKNHE